MAFDEGEHRLGGVLPAHVDRLRFGRGLPRLCQRELRRILEGGAWLRSTCK